MKRLLMRHQMLMMATMAAMLFAACTADRPEQEGISHGLSGSWSTDPIAFGVSDSTRSDTIAPPPMLTRNPQNEGTLTTVQTSGFGVFAARTGAHKYANSSISSNFMFNEKIYYESSSWRYDLTKYWPNGEDGADEYISFFAYAPYSDGSATTCVTDFSLPIELGDPWLVFKLPPDPIENQIDLLYAAKVDQQKSTNSGKVEFAFKHALACVGDTITTAVSEELGTLLKTEVTGNASLTQIDVKLRKITIDYTLTQKGRLALGSKARWQPVMSEAPTITRSVIIDHMASPVTLATITSGGVSGNEQSDADNGVFYIPVQAGDNEQKATISLDYTITRTFSDASTTNYDGNTTTTIGLQTAGGEVAGEHLNLNLNLSENIRLRPKSLGSFYIQAPDQIYTGSALTPEVTISDGNVVLKKDVDYTLSYSNNINAGIATVTATGMGEYDTDSSISTTFIINPRHISYAEVAAIPDETYDGSPKTPAVTVSYGGNNLVLDTDYSVAYSNNTNAGTAIVTITGKGNFAGSRQVNFTIGKVSPNLSIDPTSITWAVGDGDTKAITVTRDGDGVISAAVTSGLGVSVSVTDNTVTLSRTGNPPGTVVVTISVAEGTNHSAANTTCTISLNSTLALFKTWLAANYLSYANENNYMGLYVDASGNITSTNSGAIGRIIDYTYKSSGKSNVDEGLPDATILVLALTNASEGCMWKTSNTAESVYNDTSKKNGYQFTLDHFNSTYPAAQAAASYSVSRPEGASTWFLPSYSQLWGSLSKLLLSEIMDHDVHYWLGTVSPNPNNNTKAARLKFSAASSAWDYSDFTDSYKVRACFAY